MSKRAFNLDPQTVKDLTAVYPVDKSTFAEQKYETGNVKRTLAVTNIDASGSSTSICDFTNYELINLTVNQSNTVTLSVPTNTRVVLKINKGVNDIISFYQRTITHDGIQLGNPSLTYDIIRIGDIFIINQINDQFKSLNNSSILTSPNGTITAGGDFNIYVDGKVGTLYSSFVITKTGTDTNEIEINYPKRYDFYKANNPINVFTSGSESTSSGLITETVILIRRSSNFLAGVAYTIRLSGSIILE